MIDLSELNNNKTYYLQLYIKNRKSIYRRFTWFLKYKYKYTVFKVYTLNTWEQNTYISVYIHSGISWRINIKRSFTFFIQYFGNIDLINKGVFYYWRLWRLWI